MKHSPRHKWQTRWKIDGQTVTHETGLTVKLIDGLKITIDEDRVREDLAVQHGHNAQAMVNRLLREADQLLLDGQSAKLRGAATPHPGNSN